MAIIMFNNIRHISFDFPTIKISDIISWKCIIRHKHMSSTVIGSVALTLIYINFNKKENVPLNIDKSIEMNMWKIYHFL